MAPNLKLSASKDQNKEQLYIVRLLEDKSISTQFSNKIIYASHSSLVLKLRRKDLELVLQDPTVTYIQKYSFPSVESPIPGHDLSVNNITYTHSKFSDLKGKNIKISIKEELFDTLDLDIKNRFELNGSELNSTSQHASAIATLIAGAGNTSWQGQGVAEMSTVTSSSYLNLLPDTDDIFLNNQIYIQNHSYGSSIESFYGAEAAAYDKNVQNLTELVHVFSSGNSGLASATTGIYANIEGYSNLTGNFKMAKNIITVGAIDKNKMVIDRSSKGPAYDGRVKPELVAYATNGTSDAAALVSGSVTLLQEAYLKKNNNYPHADLIKSILIAGAEDVGMENVDFETGYGNLDLFKSLQILNSGNYFQGSIGSAEIRKHEIEIPENISSLKITISWIDPPANPGDEKALINDLDSSLRSESGKSWLPWTLDSSPFLESIMSAAKRKKDTLNNVEVISIKNPTPGSYTYTVMANNTLLNDNQNYAVAYNLELKDEFNWTFPDSDHSLINLQRNRIRWENSFDQETAVLEINVNNKGWQVISQKVQLNNESYDLNLDSISGTALLRMTIGEKSYLSEEFVISKTLKPEVEFNCDDEIGISWDKIEGANAYVIKYLGDLYLKEFNTVSDTTFTILKSELPNRYLSVSPIFDDLEGANGLTVEYNTQGVQCFYTNFYALLLDKEHVNASLNLSTALNIEKVEFINNSGNSISVIQQFFPPFNNLNLSLTDSESLMTGDNEYYALIYLKNGNIITTEKVTINIPDSGVFQVYPNPVRSGEDLFITSKGDDLKFQLFDLEGRMILKDVLFQYNDRIQMPFITKGIYIIWALRGDEKVGSKKIIIK